jgi:hypothetical protein
VAVIAAISILVLWSFYGFRYAARPAGMQLVPSLSQYAAALSPFERDLILTAARFHLFPESWLMGITDIRVFGHNFNTFAFGQWYPHGLWWYFPFVLAIKTTIALLAGVAVVLYAGLRGKLRDRHRALAYVLISGVIYLAVAIQNGLNIGVRHILPICPLMAMLGGAGLAALSAHSRKWTHVTLALLASHIISSLVVFPNTIAYANEAWGEFPRSITT